MKSSLLEFEDQTIDRNTDVYKSRPGFPLTDYNYQPTTEAPLHATAHNPSVGTTTHTAEMRSFRKLSMSAIGAESRWQFGFEATVLAFVVGLAGWSLVALVSLMQQTAGGWYPIH